MRLALLLLASLAYGVEFDDFNRADGAPGASWTTASGTWAIASNRMYQTAGLDNSYPGGWILLHNSGTYDDVSVQARLWKPSIDQRTVGLILRYSNSGGNLSFYQGWVRRVNASPDEWRIVRYSGTISAGSFTVLSTATSAFTDGGTVRFRASGSSLVLEQWSGTAWVTRTSATDATLSTGAIGLRANEQQAQFDDFYATSTPSSSGLSSNRSVITDGSGVLTTSPATATEVGYLSGVTSSIQTQLAAKAALSHAHAAADVSSGVFANARIPGPSTAGNLGGVSTTQCGSGLAVTGYNSSGEPVCGTAGISPLTASRALVSDGAGAVAVSATTATEIGYISGLTSAVQTQLNAKAATSHSHAASDTTSGVFANARIPGPGASSFGGITTTACSGGQAVQSYDSSGLPVCITAGSGSAGAGSSTSSFTAQTSVTLAHNLNSKNILVTCYDGSDNWIDWNTLATTSVNAATVTFTSAQTGRCTAALGGGGSRYHSQFTSQTSITFLGTVHNLGSPDLQVVCKDNSSPRQVVEPNTVTIDDNTFDVVITFSTAQTGACSIL